jgi:hypothetical protein
MSQILYRISAIPNSLDKAASPELIPEMKRGATEAG